MAAVALAWASLALAAVPPSEAKAAASPGDTTGSTTVLTAPYASADGRCYVDMLSSPALTSCVESHDATAGRLTVQVEARTPGVTGVRSRAINAVHATTDLQRTTRTVDVSMTTRIERLRVTSEGDAGKHREVRLWASAAHSACPGCGGGTWLETSLDDWTGRDDDVSVVDVDETVTFTMSSWDGPIPPGTITITLENYDEVWVFDGNQESIPGAPYCDTMVTIQCQPIVPDPTSGGARIDLSLTLSRVEVTPRS